MSLFQMKIFHPNVSFAALLVCKHNYAKFACLDAWHLSGKLKGMLICATNQDSNGTIFILAHGLVPREDEEIKRGLVPAAFD